jgi:nucleotide-binding universal stress UspA family protein
LDQEILKPISLTNTRKPASIQEHKNHSYAPWDDTEILPPPADALMRPYQARSGVPEVTPSVSFFNRSATVLILRQATLGGHQLIVLGTKAWSGDRLHFGHSAEVLIENAPCPILIMKS